MISFNGLDRFFDRYGDELGRLVGRTLASQRPLRSWTVLELEERVADETRPGGRAVAVRSGTDALHLVLRALGIGAGDEVIVTSCSFVASASAIRLCGARPVFVEVDPATGLMSLDAVRRALGPACRAIVAVQLYGHLLPFDELEALAAAAGVALSEDAAQAFGSRRDERPAGSLGTASTFSFDPTKAVGGIETGGAVVTSDPALADAVVALRYHGSSPEDGQFRSLGYNSQLSSANASVLLWRLDREPERRARRHELATRLARRLRSLPRLALTPGADDETWNAYRFSLRLDDAPLRDRLLAAARAAGIECKIHYRYVLPDLKAMVGESRCPDPIPGARERSATTLSLPMHPELTHDEVDAIADVVEEIVGS